MSKLRGVQDIRTISGRVDQTFKPYKAFLRLGCMEMEKARMIKEKEGILLRLQSIDARLEDMEAEKRALMKTVGYPQAKSPSSDSNEGDGKTSAIPGGFRLRY